MSSRALVTAGAVTATVTSIIGYNRWRSSKIIDASKSPETDEVVIGKQNTQIIGIAQNRSSNLSECIDKARAHIKNTMIEYGVPGCSVAVMKDGRCVWSEGLGYADVENNVACSPSSGKQ